MELGTSHSDLPPNVRALIATRRATSPAPAWGHYKDILVLSLHSPAATDVPLCVQPLCFCARAAGNCGRRTSRRADVHLFLCFSPPPPDRRQYEAGTGLCVSATLRAPWRCAELQTLCFRPHASHTLHAGGGDDQLVVVCMSFSAVYLTAVCLQVIQPVKIGRNFHTLMSHFPEWSRLSGAAANAHIS